MEKYLKSVSKECLEKILEQMNNSICTIQGKDGKNETGVFCLMRYYNENIPTLLIKNNINNNDYKDKIKVSLNNNNNKIIGIKNKIYKNYYYNISIIELEEKYNDIKYIEIDDKIFEKESQMIYYNESIYVMQLNNRKDISLSYGIIKDINNKNNNSKYIANIDPKYNFNLLFNLTNNKLIGFHENKGKYYNICVLYKTIIKDFRIRKKYNLYDHDYFKENIEIFVNVQEKNINKKIYFLDNGYRDDNFIKHDKHKNLIELSDYNTEIYINKKQYENKKYFIPDKEGEYEINLKFYNNLMDYFDCSYMFAGCDKITNINFVSFITKNIINMKYMFYGCENLKIMNNISIWDVSNVTDISYIFSNCKSINSLPDISKWETKSVTNMKGLFNYCEKLKILPDISKWNTSNVTDISYMFNKCESLKSLPDISKWDIKKVNDMSDIFFICKRLNSLPDISTWDTKKVINMSYMFSDCYKLNSLPDISKWDTKNVTDMSGMFDNCYALKSLPDISKWNTSNVIDMRYMFYFCNFHSFPDISKWDIRNVTDMKCMFVGSNIKIPEKFLNK